MNTATQLLQETYQALYGPKVTLKNLGQLAGDLSQLAQRPRPWTGKYLYNVLKQYPGFPVNPKLVEALSILASRLDGVDEVQARARQVAGVLALSELPEGTLILGEAQPCDNPTCRVVFVPTHPRQKFHSRACQREAYKLKKMAEFTEVKAANL